MFKRILITFFVLLFPIFTFAETGSIFHGTGITDQDELNITNNGSGDIIDTPIQENIFETDFKILFQNPSYILEKDLEKQEYLCDNSKDECKVNFKLVKNDGNSLSSKLGCEINFGFVVDLGIKCNPTTLIFPSGENNVIFKVYEKEKIENFTLKNILIKNNKLEEITSSGSSEVETSGTGVILDETGTGVIIIDETSSGSTQTSTGILVPEPLIEVQSGLIFSGTGELWNCKKEDCKVNLTAENIFTGSFDKSNYECIWSFSGGTYGTGTENKCNPGYVDYTLGEYKIDLKVFEIGNIDNFKESFILVNNKAVGETSGTGVIVDETGTGAIIIDETSSGSTQASTGILVPEPLIEVQSGLIFSGTGELWNCKKEDCKVNLTSENIFTGSFEKSNYECLWSFSGGTYGTGTENKCNPGYIDYPLGEYKIELKVFEKGNINNFKESFIYIKNIKTNKIVSSGGSNNIKPKEIKPLKEIIIQTGLTFENGSFVCKEKECKVNLTYQKSYKDVCLWDFGSGNFRTKYLYTCNPGIVYFPSGEHKVSLKVFEDDVLKGEKFLNFSNVYQSQKQKNNREPEAKITLQGVISKTKTLSGSTLICKDVEKCNVNLTGVESYDIDNDNLSFNWDFGNGEFSDKLNPSGIWYLTGKHNISLEVQDGFGGVDKKEFFVEVIGKEKSEEEVKEKNDELLEEDKDKEAPFKEMFLEITKVLANPKGVDKNEWIEIKNVGEYKINIKGLIIDDILEKGSKAYIVKEDIFLKYNQTYRFYKFDTKLSLNNTGDEVNLIYNDIILDTLSRNFSVRDNYILTHKNLEIKRQKVFVEKVIDGDTIVIKLITGETEKLRLIGVDTPETKHPRKKIEFYGLKASSFTKKYLEGKSVILEIDPNNYRDKYGRLLGYIFVESDVGEDIFFNKLLIETGNARGYYKFDFNYIKDFEKAENLAKKSGLGLWEDKEVKKIFLKETREDKEYAESLLLEEDIENNLFIDIDNNNIPDVFESIESESINSDDEIFEFSAPKKSIINQEKYNTFIQNSFIIKASYLKSGLKISGKSLPNSSINIGFGDNEVSLTSDNKGNFSYIFEKLISGNYDLTVELTDSLGNNFIILKTPEIKLKKEYLDELLQKAEEKRLKDEKRKNKKYIALLKRQEKAKKKAEKKAKKKKSDNKIVSLKINENISEEKQLSSIPFFLIVSLMLIVGILGFFIILKKGGIFDTQNFLSIMKNEYREKVFLIID